MHDGSVGTRATASENGDSPPAGTGHDYIADTAAGTRPMLIRFGGEPLAKPGRREVVNGCPGGKGNLIRAVAGVTECRFRQREDQTPVTNTLPVDHPVRNGHREPRHPWANPNDFDSEPASCGVVGVQRVHQQRVVQRQWSISVATTGQSGRMRRLQGEIEQWC